MSMPAISSLGFPESDTVIVPNMCISPEQAGLLFGGKEFMQRALARRAMIANSTPETFSGQFAVIREGIRTVSVSTAYNNNLRSYCLQVQSTPIEEEQFARVKLLNDIYESLQTGQTNYKAHY